MRVRHLAAIAMLGALSCRMAPAAPSIVVTARNGELELDNLSGQRIYYRAFERGLAERVRFIPCTTTVPECESMGANSTLRLRYSELQGYSDGAREAVVFWWFPANSADGTSTPDTIRSVVVPL